MRIVPAGDGALIVELPGGVDPEVSARAVTLKARIEARCPGLKDVVVAFNALAIYFDPLVHRRRGAGE